MKENKKRCSVLVEEGGPNKKSDLAEDQKTTRERLKKPLIFGLMAFVFVGCIYLIFKPSTDKNEMENFGLNDAVPQATDAEMQDDKQKAYEQEMLEQKDQEKRNTLTTLSDYWNEGSTAAEIASEEENIVKKENPTLSSYRNAQSALGSFYTNGNSETMELRKQVDELKNQLAEKEVPKPATLDDQLVLMEKSYQMASKYLPVTATTAQVANADPTTSGASGSNQKEHFVAFMPSKKNTVSALYREPSDSAFLEDWSQIKNRGFYTAGAEKQVMRPKNSIKASIHDAQTVMGETAVRLRLLEPAKTPNHTIPKGTVVTANAKFQGGRLQLKVTSIELEGNIIPAAITIYDLDGQPGLNVPYSPESNALTDIAANMGNATGSSFSMSSTTGQQITSDLSKSAVQGISGYFAKKVRTPKIILKAGHQVFLVSKQ